MKNIFATKCLKLVVNREDIGVCDFYVSCYPKNTSNGLFRVVNCAVKRNIPTVPEGRLRQRHFE